MSSATKTLELLHYFTAERPEIGLSELCRLARRDKATTHRHLQDLEKTGLVEQNTATREYRLGPAVLQLAQTREATVPRKAGAELPVRWLAEAVGETVHVSVLSGTTLYTLHSCESSRHSIRVIVDVPTLPLHATASGLCALAFGPAGLIETASARMDAYTTHTMTTRAALEAAVDAARRTGFARANRTFEDGVYSLSVPLFDQTGLCAGALSLASVASRFPLDDDHAIRRQLVIAGRQITRNWGGAVPETLERCWSASDIRSNELEQMP